MRDNWCLEWVKADSKYFGYILAVHNIGFQMVCSLLVPMTITLK